MTIRIRNGRILDPRTGMDQVGDVWIENEMIVMAGDYTERTGEKVADREIDASGLWICPGLIDLHVHFRDPGQTHKETIATGSRAAAAGGFTTVCAMPNTVPPVDSVETVRYIKEQAKKTPVANLLVIGAITKGQKGEELSDIRGMAEEGICALSEDGKSVMNADLMKQAMERAKDFHLPIFDHCEDATLAHGCVNPCTAQKALDLPALDGIAEEAITARDTLLAAHTGCQLHICHVSTEGSAEIVRVAKEHGVSVTAEVGPHHFSLDDREISRNDANYKMNPPLRSKKDKEAMQAALSDGTIDCIATDHAPHHESEKNLGLEKSANGIVGLETAVPISVTTLVRTGILTPLQLIEKMSTNPAKILGINKGTLKPGSVADLVLIDPNQEYTIDKNTFYTMGRNTPYDGRNVYGKVKMTILGGRIVFEEGKGVTQ